MSASDESMRRQPLQRLVVQQLLVRSDAAHHEVARPRLLDPEAEAECLGPVVVSLQVRRLRPLLPVWMQRLLLLLLLLRLGSHLHESREEPAKASAV